MSAEVRNRLRSDHRHTARANALRAVPLPAQRVVTVDVPGVVGNLVSRHLGDRAFGQLSIVLVTVSGMQIIGIRPGEKAQGTIPGFVLAEHALKRSAQ